MIHTHNIPEVQIQILFEPRCRAAFSWNGDRERVLRAPKVDFSLSPNLHTDGVKTHCRRVMRPFIMRR